MNGIKLEELDSPQMVDVLHYLFEEDLTAPSKEFMDARTEVRKIIYGEMYETEYLFGLSDKSSSKNYTASGESLDSFDDIIPFDPTVKQVRKGYIAPTNLDEDSSKPFGDILDGPLK